MVKFVGGVVVGTFVGAVVLELLKRFRPELVENIEKQAKAATDRLFESLRDDLGVDEMTSREPY